MILELALLTGCHPEKSKGDQSSHAVQSTNSGRSENLNTCTFRRPKSIASILESALRTTVPWAVSGAVPPGKHVLQPAHPRLEKQQPKTESPKSKLVRPMSPRGSLTQYRGRVTEKSNGDPQTATSFTDDNLMGAASRSPAFN